MSRKIALTGATGFIGSALVRRLEAAGWQIQALVRPTSMGRRQAADSTQWVQGDLENLDSLRNLVDGVDTIVHCAGVVRGGSRVHFNRINVDGVARLVQVATEQHRVPRFLLISSLAARVPHLSPYAASKRQGEDVLAKGAGAMAWAALRPPAVYGPGDKELLPLFRWIGRGIAPILGSRSARFSLLYVEDLAEAVIQWLNSESSERQTFELHDGHQNGYTWSDVVNTVSRLYDRSVLRVQVPVVLLRSLAAVNIIGARLFGYAPMLTFGKIREFRHPDWVCDNSALSRETGWAPCISLEEGLRRTLRLDSSV